MTKRIHKIAAYCMIATITIGGQSVVSHATEIPVAGIDVVLNEYYQNNSNENADITKYLTDVESQYANLAISSVTNYVNIRSKASEDSDILGKLYNDCAATILATEGDWYKVKSGTVTGYVKSEYLVTGDGVDALAKKVGNRLATVTTTTLKVRSEANLDSSVETLVPIEEELNVTKEIDGWVKVSIDADTKGYVSADYVELKTEFKEAESIEEEEARLKAEEEKRIAEEAREAEEARATEESQTVRNQSSNVARSTRSSSNTSSSSSASSTYNNSPTRQSTSSSSIRNSIVNYAMRFVGNPYVWGGTSLTNGTDCSGFTQSVFRDNGISIPRNSRSQASSGREISISNLQLGDLVFYGSGGTINHVAIYIGNGQVISASNPEYGIRVSAYNYRQPYRAVSYIN